MLTPGRYVGAADEAADGEPFAEKTAQLQEQFARSAELEGQIKKNLGGLGLRRYRQFYARYPQIREALPPGLLKITPPIRETLSPESCLPGKTLLQRLSFSHFAELLQLDEPLKRRF